MTNLGAIIIISIVLLSLLILIFIVWAGPVGAPWFPTSLKNVRRMLRLADVQPGEVVYDVGSGDGRVLFFAARNFGARAVGIEIDPLRCLWTQLLIWALGLRGQVRIVWDNIFAQDLSEADVVIIYLLPKTNVKLMKKLWRELRSGARIVTHLFPIPGWACDAIEEEGPLYLYTIREEQKAYGRGRKGVPEK